MKSLSLLFGASLALAGCGGNGTTTMDMGGGACDAGAYPCGPYGVTPGAIIDNVTGSGRTYMDGTPVGAVHDLRLGDYYANKSIKALAILFSAEWCGPCKAEQPSVVTLYKNYQSNGGKVAMLELVIQKADSSPADASTIDTWASTYKIPFDMAFDPNGAFMAYYNTSAFPQQMVISTRDMKIQWQGTGMAADLQAQIDAVLAQ